MCENQRCKWYGLNWLFDVNPDGSVPEPKVHRKAYPAIPDNTELVQSAIDNELRRSRGNR